MYSTLSQISNPCMFLLQEQNIKEDYNKYSYTKEIFSYRPVCPVSVEKERDVETSDALFVQEKPKPIVLLIPEDIKCDGLLCPIPPIESQLKRPDPELYKVIIWDFLWIDPYIKLLMTPTENTSRLKGEFMDLMSVKKLVVLLDLLCLCWYYRTTSKKKKDSSSAETAPK
ncbi:hypothetical protein XELAEV_18008355mg [Xenopus laevis]|uniref:Uncharacterized protein n=1 Tax=Xenopus laevis TaxID=8355 RepID=A0A974E4I4_XENLA|nr:hypothetical protein XELAEV_18008355mg [Xenopus laevis]